MKCYRQIGHMKFWDTGVAFRHFFAEGFGITGIERKGAVWCKRDDGMRIMIRKVGYLDVRATFYFPLYEEKEMAA